MDFSCHQDGDRLRVRWDLRSRDVCPGRLALSLPAVAPAVSVIDLSGRGPLWLYAGLSAALADPRRTLTMTVPQYHPASIVVWPAAATRLTAGCLVAPAGTTAPPQAQEPRRSSVRFTASTGDAAIAWELASPRGDLDPSCLAGLPDAVDAVAGNRSPERVTWQSPVPVWFAAALSACVARRHPGTELSWLSPAEAGVVTPRWDPDTRRLEFAVSAATRESAKEGHLIGVVGDPNSGKSVFSWKLYESLQRLGVTCYRTDCDVAAPTARWGVTTASGEQLRRASKRPWNDSRDVPMLVERLGRLRRSVAEIVVVDLPGGRHDGPLPVRIPEARVPLFAAIDRYIVVQKTDAIADAWRNALRGAHPRSEIVAEVCSRRFAPTAPPAPLMNRPDSDRIWPRPLERQTLRLADPAIDALARRLASPDNH